MDFYTVKEILSRKGAEGREMVRYIEEDFDGIGKLLVIPRSSYLEAGLRRDVKGVLERPRAVLGCRKPGEQKDFGWEDLDLKN